jgi:hypothetical protein
MAVGAEEMRSDLKHGAMFQTLVFAIEMLATRSGMKEWLAWNRGL